MDSVALNVARLEDDHPAEAIKILDQVWESNQHSDRDGWLRRSVQSRKASIFWRQGRHEDALAIRRSLTADYISLGSTQAGNEELILNQTILAANLRDLRRYEEALSELRIALGDPTVMGMMKALKQYAEIAEVAGAPVPPEYGTRAISVAELWGIIVPSGMSPKNNPADFIRYIVAEHDHASRRHGRLLRQLRLINDKAERIQKLADHIATEAVGWYRADAERRIEEERTHEE